MRNLRQPIPGFLGYNATCKLLSWLARICYVIQLTLPNDLVKFGDIEAVRSCVEVIYTSYI